MVESATDKSSPITDRLHPALGGPGYDRLLVVSLGEVNVFADGAAIEMLKAAYPNIPIVSSKTLGYKHGNNISERSYIANLPELLRSHGCGAVISAVGA